MGCDRSNNAVPVYEGLTASEFYQQNQYNHHLYHTPSGHTAKSSLINHTPMKADILSSSCLSIKTSFFFIFSQLSCIILRSIMYTSSRITREQFLNSHFLKITVADLEKSLLHHNRFVLEVITDRSKETSKKKFSEILRFSQEIQQKSGLKDLAVQNHMRSSKQLEQVQLLFKKLNSGYLCGGTTQNQQLRAQLRNNLYNLLFSNIEQLPSSSQQDMPSSSPTLNPKPTVDIAALVAPIKEKQDECFQEKNKEKESVKLPNVIRSMFKAKRDSQDFRRRDAILKNIKSIWLKQEKKWSEKLFSVTDDCLILVEKVEPQQKHIVFLKFLQVSLEEQEYYRIKISHPLLIKAVQIRLNSFQEAGKDDRQQYVNLLGVLKDSCDKGQQQAYNFVGVYLSNKKNKFMVQPQKRPAQRLSIRLTHQDQTYSFALAIDSGVFLQLPVLNNYGQYEAEVVEQRQSGGIIALSSQKSTSFRLPIQNIYDQLFNDRPKRRAPEMKSHILQSRQCNYSLRLEYYPLTSWKAFCSGNPATDRFEGELPPAEFSREEFRIHRNRAKRIIYSVQQWMRYVGGLKNFEYPLQSLLFYLVLLLTVLGFDANSLPLYIVGAACILLAVLHPSAHAYFREFVSLLVPAASGKVEAALWQGGWQGRFRVGLKKIQEKRRFLEGFNMRTKKKRNILEKYNRLQQVLLQAQLILAELVGLCEKAKNLFSWYHHRKTKWLFLSLCALLLVLSLISLRFLALLALARMFHKGRHHHARLQQLNQVIVYSLLRITVEEEGLISLRDYFEDPAKPFDKRSSQYSTFERKGSAWISDTLQLQFDGAIFAQARCMNELVGWLSDCRDRYIIPQEVCRKYRFNLEWATRGGSLSRVISAAYLLLLSVPSDRSILEVKVDEEQDDSEEEELA